MGTIEEEVYGGSQCGFIHITDNGGGASENGPTMMKVSYTDFLIKLYKMVDDKVTDYIISWGSSCNTFIISDERRFISEILPYYFRMKHFDNFTYQLNNYGFKKKEGDRLEFEHEYFQLGNQHLLKNIKRGNQPLMATNKMPKPTLSVAIDELESLFAKVKHTQKQIKNKIHWIKDDIGNSLSEVKSIIKDNSHKLISTFSEGRKRKVVDVRFGTDFVDISKDFELMYGQFESSVTHIDGFMALSDLNEKLANDHKNNDIVGGVGNGRRVPLFLQKLYDMVEKEEINSFISWSLPNRDSFIIRDINEFASHVLPMYFTHTNFSSFNSQLNIYGFKKISSVCYEYANEWFLGGRHDLLVNIKRRDKNPLSTHSTINLSSTEVEMFKDQLKTIKQEQENKIIRLSNYEEQMKSSVYEFKETIVNIANIVNKMILTSNKNLENAKRPKIDTKDNIIDDCIGYMEGQDLEDNDMTSIHNNNIGAQAYIPGLVTEDPWIVEREMEPYLSFCLGRESEIDKLNSLV